MIFHKFLLYTKLKDLGSNLKHETSLIMSALFFIEKSITKDFLVSINNNVLGNFFLNCYITFFTLIHNLVNHFSNAIQLKSLFL